MEIPPSFTTQRGDRRKPRPIVVREELDTAQAGALLERVAAVRWSEFYHAYGPAADVPAQLAAVIAGDDATRAEAWWNLWGNILHQGTVYEATVPAVPVLLAIAKWRQHPDREQAISMLREAAATEDIRVWRYDGAGAIVSDPQAQRRLHAALHVTVNAGAESLLRRWRAEPAVVQRALLWLLSVLPVLRSEHEALVAEVLPSRHRPAWEIETARAAHSQDDADAVVALEDWIHAGGEG